MSPVVMIPLFREKKVCALLNHNNLLPAMKLYYSLPMLLILVVCSCKNLEDKPTREEWIHQRFEELKDEYGLPASMELFDIDPAAYTDQLTEEQIETEMRAKMAWWAENYDKIDQGIQDANEADRLLAIEKREKLAKVHTKRDSLLVLLEFPDEARHIPRELLEYYDIEVKDVPIDTSAVKN